VILLVSDMDHMDRVQSDIVSMTTSARREQMERNVAEGRMERGRHVDGLAISTILSPNPSSTMWRTRLIM